MFGLFKRRNKITGIGVNPSPKSKRPTLPLSNDYTTICNEPQYPKPPRPGEKMSLSSGEYKIINVKCEDYNALNQVNFDKYYLLKDIVTGATEWVDEYRMKTMKSLGLIKK